MLTHDQVQIFATYVLLDEILLGDITTAIVTDCFAKEIKASLKDPTYRSQRDDLEKFSFRDGVLLRNNLVYVLEGLCRIHILIECHDGLLAGHFGVAKTLKLIPRTYR